MQMHPRSHGRAGLISWLAPVRVARPHPDVLHDDATDGHGRDTVDSSRPVNRKRKRGNRGRCDDECYYYYYTLGIDTCFTPPHTRQQQQQ